MQPNIEILAPAVSMSGRVIIFATCAECGWQAKMTGDTEEEVDDFLRRALITHMAETHGRPS